MRKLYPQAQLPRFTVLEIEERVMRLAYESPRSMEALAVGLMLGAAEHFGEQVKISHTAGTVEGRPATVFHIDKKIHDCVAGAAGARTGTAGRR
ncbi:heme NO-binding domain-containing protein [Undibacterium arcticum]